MGRGRRKLVRLVHEVRSSLARWAGDALRISGPERLGASRVGFPTEVGELQGLGTAVFGSEVWKGREKPRLYELADVAVTGSEGNVFLPDGSLFGDCAWVSRLNLAKVRRPIRWLAQRVTGRVFVLSCRCPENRGHFLVEHLPRLVLGLPLLHRGEPEMSVLLSPHHAGYQREYLRKLGVSPERCVEASTGTTVCERAFFIPLLSTGDHDLMAPPELYSFLRSRLLEGVPQLPKEPVFISRRDAPDRRLLNEDELFERAQRAFPGMKRVCMGKLSFNEQLEVMRNASVVVGAHSQAFCYLLFTEGAVSLQLTQGISGVMNPFLNWSLIYDRLGEIAGTRSETLLSEAVPEGDADWVFPVEVFDAALIRARRAAEERQTSRR
jgi:hypothetical protein